MTASDWQSCKLVEVAYPLGWKIKDLSARFNAVPVTIRVTIKVTIVVMVTGRMGLEPILSIKVPVTIGPMLYFNSDCDSDGHGVGTCKHILKEKARPKILILGELMYPRVRPPLSNHHMRNSFDSWIVLCFIISRWWWNTPGLRAFRSGAASQLRFWLRHCRRW